MTTNDIPALREALAASKMSLPLEADDVAVFDAEGDLVADTVGNVWEAENARLIALAVNALPKLLDRIERLERVAEAARWWHEAEDILEMRDAENAIENALADLDGEQR